MKNQSPPRAAAFRRVTAFFGIGPGCLIWLTLFLQATSFAVAITTPAFVQEKDYQVTSGPTSRVTFSAPTTAGNLIVAYLIWDNTGSVSVSDSLGNTYAAAVGPTRWSNSRYSTQIFYAIAVRGGGNTVTATFATRINSFGIIYAHEYSGVQQAAPIDVTAAASGSFGSLSSGPASTTNDTDLLFAGGVSARTVTSPGAGFTARSNFQGNMTEDRIVSVKGPYGATASNSGGAWAMQMVAFKGAGGGVVPDTTPPTVPTGLAASPISSSQINLSWVASTDPGNSSSQITYGVYRNGTRIATTAVGATSWADTGLVASTPYSYTVSATDGAGNSSAQTASVSATTAAAPQTPDTQSPSVSITSPANNQAVSGVTTITANAADNVGVIGVQFQVDGGNVGGEIAMPPYSINWDTSQATNGSHILTASARDAAGNRTVSPGVTVVVGSASLRPYSTTFPLTQNPIAEGGNWTNGGATGLDWHDCRTTPGFVFGTQPGTINYDDSTCLVTGSWGPTQTVQATVRIVAGDATQFEEVEVRLRSAVSAHRITGYEVNCSVKPGDPYMQIVRWNGALGSFTLLDARGVGCANGDVLKGTIVGNIITAYKNGTPIFQVTDGTFTSGAPGMGFYIQNGSSGTNANFGFSNFLATDGSTTTDTAPPSVPANLAANVVSPSQINLSWSASTDNVAALGYQVFRNNSQIATTTTASFSDKAVTPGVQYNYAIAAYDAAGNASIQSSPVTAATSLAPDITPPSIPTGLQSSNVTSTSLKISWSPSNDDVAVAGYRVFRNSVQVGSTPTTSYTDTGLAASTTYVYTVVAYDSSNNASDPSQELIVTTTTAAVLPPSFIQANHNQISSGTSASAAFNAPTTAGNTVVVYVIWNNIGAVSLADSRGDTFVNVGAPVSWGNGYSAQVFYATKIAGGADTITATFRTPVSSFGVVYVHEYAGISAINPVDVTVSASGSSSLLNSGNAVTTSPNDLIFGAGVSDNIVTAAGSGFLSRDLAYGNVTEDRIAASTGAYASTATHNGNKWGMQMVAFRAAQ